MKRVIVRTYSAGCFAGLMVSRKGKEVVLKQARRLWYWAGAASLSQLAVSGTSKPNECKFPIAMPEVVLTEAIEIIGMTDKAWKQVQEINPWTA